MPFKIAWGASQGGTAINAVAPAQAGTVAMIGMFRASIPGSSVAGLTSATVVESFFFAAVSVLTVVVVAIFLPRTVSKGPSIERGSSALAARAPSPPAASYATGAKRTLDSLSDEQ